MDYLNTDKKTYLIKLNWKLTNNTFIVQGNGIIEVLKKFGEKDKGIEYIKEFNPTKLTFKRVSKKAILEYYSWNTEVIEYLKNVSYFN